MSHRITPFVEEDAAMHGIATWQQRLARENLALVLVRAHAKFRAKWPAPRAGRRRTEERKLNAQVRTDGTHVFHAKTVSAETFAVKDCG